MSAGRFAGRALAYRQTIARGAPAPAPRPARAHARAAPGPSRAASWPLTLEMA